MFFVFMSFIYFYNGSFHLNDKKIKKKILFQISTNNKNKGEVLYSI